jgi:hypothetical protein
MAVPGKAFRTLLTGSNCLPESPMTIDFEAKNTLFHDDEDSHMEPSDACFASAGMEQSDTRFAGRGIEGSQEDSHMHDASKSNIDTEPPGEGALTCDISVTGESQGYSAAEGTLDSQESVSKFVDCCAVASVTSSKRPSRPRFPHPIKAEPSALLKSRRHSQRNIREGNSADEADSEADDSDGSSRRYGKSVAETVRAITMISLI